MPDLPIQSIDNVGPDMIAVELEAPSDLEAYPGQFVLVRATVDGEEETGYYTISSPFIDDTFEITVEEPHVNITYAGERDVFVMASGPGIGPAIGIGERAVASESDVTIAYYGEDPPHEHRLRSLRESGATVIVSDDENELIKGLETRDDEHIFVFGFKEFVDRSKRLFSEVDVNPDDADVESFGPA